MFHRQYSSLPLNGYSFISLTSSSVGRKSKLKVLPPRLPRSRELWRWRIRFWSNKCFVPLKTRVLYQLAQLRLGEGKVPDVKVLQDVVLEIKKKPCQQHANKSGSNCNCNDEEKETRTAAIAATAAVAATTRTTAAIKNFLTSLTLFGMTMNPSCRRNLMSTCAGDLAYFLLILTT